MVANLCKFLPHFTVATVLRQVSGGRVEDRFSSDDGCGRDIARDNGATMRLIHQCDNVRAHKLAPSKLLEYRVQQGSMYRNEISVCNALNKLPPIGSIYLVSLFTDKKIVDRIRNLIKILLYMCVYIYISCS